jgi:hypothetical protein
MFRAGLTVLKAPLVTLFAAIALAQSATAATPSVTAVLSNSSVAVGQAVEMQIRVSGGGATVPRDIAVDGLEIHQTGTSSQIEMQNFDISQKVTYSYTILPLKSGTFRIPPQTVKVGGSSLRTPELELTVTAGSSSGSMNSGHGNAPTGQRQNAKLAFAEILVTKPTAYVGEIVPVEVRLAFYSHARARLVEGPEIPSQGFTMQKLQAPDQPRMETISGNPYQVLTFKTAIAGARPGKFEIGPVQAGAIMIVPRQPGSRPRSSSPFDLFNLDDPFSDPFFTDPYSALGQQEKITLKSEPASVEVKPLPPNAPPSFAGAVGNFSLHVDANPKSVQVGDPITVTATISGRGNFDRVTAPALPDAKGWHSYPPSSKFKQDDDIGISGSKSFDVVLSPNERKDSIPPLEFSYFDPVSEKYVSLKSSAIPIHVEGEAPAAASPAASVQSSAAPAAAPSATPQVSAKPGEILSQLDERPLGAGSFTPLFLTKNFWLAQLVPLFVVIGLLIWRRQTARRRNASAVRIAALHREADDLRRKLRRDDSRPADFFADASRAIQIKTALMSNTDPERIDAAAAAKVLRADQNADERIRRIFDRRDELRYSGSSNGFDLLGPDEREQLIQFVEELAR